MAKFNTKQTDEINKIIEEINKVAKPGAEIGARNKVTLNGLLKVNKVTKKPNFFNCQREYSDAIVSFFTKEKGLVRSKFHMSAQEAIFLIS